MTWHMWTHCLATRLVRRCRCGLPSLALPRLGLDGAPGVAIMAGHARPCTPLCSASPPPPLGAEVLGVDALRAERAISCGADRTCRVWKIPEESQLIFRQGPQPSQTAWGGAAGCGQAVELF